MRKIVTEEMKEIWAKRYLQGETCRSISLDYPFNENTISKHIRKMGISRGKGNQLKYLNLKPTILQEYQDNNKITIVELARKYNISDRTISDWLHQNNIPIKQKQGLISNCQEDYFEKIDNPNKAYLLGFITADGSVTGKKGYEPRTCSIEIHEKDKELLEFAKRQINPQATITECFYDKKRNMRISFNSKKLCNDLAQYGVVRNKSMILSEVPINLIPKDLLPYYFRGLVDGDGCIHLNGAISIYSGSYDFIQSIQNILCQECNLTKNKIYKGTSYFISWNSKKDKISLFHYLYDNLTATFYYKRKYERLYNFISTNTEITSSIAQGEEVLQSVEDE